MKEVKLSIRQKRKLEILKAAEQIFINKGFNDATMEDIICATSLSRGGVYYHYKNKIAIMHDLMREGIQYRLTKMNEFLTSHSGKIDTHTKAQMLVDKVLDDTDLMRVYVVYLQAMKTNDELKALFPVLVQETLESGTGSLIASEQEAQVYSDAMVITFINTIILGAEILEDARETFIRNRGFLVEVFELLVKCFNEGSLS